MSYCSLYYELEDVMKDRPNAKPLCTNQDGGSSDEEDPTTDEEPIAKETTDSEEESGEEELEDLVAADEAKRRDLESRIEAMPSVRTTAVVAPVVVATASATATANENSLIVDATLAHKTPSKTPAKRKRLAASTNTKGGGTRKRTTTKGSNDADVLVKNMFGDGSSLSVAKEKEA